MTEEVVLAPSNLSAAERKRRPMFRGVLKYFPDALEVVSYVSQVGNDQHNFGQDLHWDKTKSTDHADALLRHLKEYAEGTKLDTDGVPVLGKVCWRALAILEQEIEKERQEKTYIPLVIGTKIILKYLGEKSIGLSRMDSRWWVRCSCGNELECGSQALFRSRCCKCNNKGPRPTRRKRPFEALYNTWVNKTKRIGRSTKATRHEVLISYDDFVKFTSATTCHYCSTPINWTEYGKGSATNLDRKDSRLPYTTANIVVCCKRCNIGKNRYFTYEEWKKIGSLIQQWGAATTQKGAPLARGAKVDG